MFKYLVLILFMVLTIKSYGDSYALPSEFNSSYFIDDHGVIKHKPATTAERDNKISVDKIEDQITRVYSKSSGTNSWQVGSIACSQNKQFNCLSVYNRDSSKIRGNQMNPFSDEDHFGQFSLYRVDSKTGVLNSLIKCKSQFTKKTTRDEGNLKNCYEYSEEKCQSWFTYLHDQGFTAEDYSKAEQCVDVFKKIDQARIKMVNTFQGEIKNSQKDIEANFDRATKDDSFVHLQAGVDVKNTTISPQILIYKDIFERSKDCSDHMALFEKDKSANARYLHEIFKEGNSGTTNPRTQDKKTNR